jgi:hypothetical protein
VAAINPGYTADLPAALIEDIASTDVAAMTVMDSAISEIINSLTPYGANLFLLRAQGVCAGVVQDTVTNTSVYVVFTGTPGFVVSTGFTVSDGTYQYIVQDGGIVQSGGTTLPLYCLAVLSGAWAVPANTVTSLTTSVPSSVTLACNNPAAGTPSAGTESTAAYQARVIQAYGRSAAQGMPSLMRTLLTNVSGVQARLIAILQQSGGGWKIIAGGGDPYAVAYAIWTSLFDVSILVGSTTTTRNITVSINNFPDVSQVVYVNPPNQTVTISLLWNTSSPNYVSPASVAAAGQPAIASYINSLVAGQPINLYQLESAFETAIADIIPSQFLTRMAFSVYINGTLTPPASGTGVIAGDPEGYFSAVSSGITITQG